MEYTFIHNRLAVGGGPVEDVDSLPFTHIITLRSNPVPEFQSPRFEVLFNGVVDDKLPKSPAWFERSLEWALPVLAKRLTKVYCHCWLGIDRSPATAFAILLAQGISEVDAERMMRQVRPQIRGTYFEDAKRAVKELGYV